MAKKIYHIPLEKTREFIKENKNTIDNLSKDKKTLEYNKLLGKARYTVTIENFINFLKIDKNIKHALATLEYFNSIKFIDELCMHFNFIQFDLEQNNINKKDFFYAFCNVFRKKNSKLFDSLFEKLFVHYHSAFNKGTDINIDYKEIAKSLAVFKKLTLKESFGELEKGCYFKIALDEKIVIDIEGNSIKTLRKKAYKGLFLYILDFDKHIKGEDVIL